MTSRWWFYPALAALALPLIPALLLIFAAMLTFPTLPSLASLTDYRPKVPLRVFSSEGFLIGEFGEERRELLKIDEVPDLMKNAILAAEDDRFYEHGGVDYIGAVRAAVANILSGSKRQGSSTITMQVARNFFLSSEKAWTRKFNEVLLAFKIEHDLSKDEILQLYINQIYLGQRSYGFAAAGLTYFGKPLAQLSLAETAMLAGLPKAPSSYNPVVNPKRAKIRQMYVLRRMHTLGMISNDQFDAAKEEPIVVKHGSIEFAVKANYLSEMVRQVMYERYQKDAYTQGFNVYTTIRLKDQEAAYTAVRKGVLDYDHRHGYRGPEGFIDLRKDNSEEFLEDSLQDVSNNDDLIPGIVESASRNKVKVYTKGGLVVEITGKGLRFAEHSLGKKLALNQRIRTGSLVRVQKNDGGSWQITQLPQVEAAFVSANPRNGEIYSLVGGFDFNKNQFNHVTQAWRQPGSGFKPFIYSAALEKGFTPASIINDAPLVFDSAQTGNQPWQPKNFEDTFDGPTRMRQGLIKSKNLVSIRILQAIGPEYAQDYVTKFGFDKKRIPPYLTMALGAGSATPMQLLTGYSAFANGGFRIMPYFIQRIENAQGNLVSQSASVVAGSGAEQIIDVRNAFTMVNMLQDVVRHGTGKRALSLGRQDLAGKTGTTSDTRDAWFCGFQPTVVAISWVGFDFPRSLGDRETGGGAALPIWINYMGSVLKGVPEAEYTMPDNMVVSRINENGLRDPNGTRDEYFYQENLPPAVGESLNGEDIDQDESVKDQLF